MNIKIKIPYSIETQTPFHIGTGSGRGLIDRTSLRDSQDNLYIPGSVIKGNLRDIAGQIALLNNLDVCSPHDENLKCFGNNPCILCRIFGDRRRGGGLFFDDLIMDDKDKEIFNQAKYLQWEERTRTKINRRFNITEHASLFTTEYGTRSVKFNGLISGYISDATPIERDPDFSYEILLLVTALQSLERVGGDRSCGTGWIRVEIDPQNPRIEEKNILYNSNLVPLIEIFDFYLGFLFQKDNREEANRA